MEIHRLKSEEEAEVCALMMAESEPWITLGRSYQSSLEIISDPSKEVYLALGDGEILGFVVARACEAHFLYFFDSLKPSVSISIALTTRSRGCSRARWTPRCL